MSILRRRREFTDKHRESCGENAGYSTLRNSGMVDFSESIRCLGCGESLFIEDTGVGRKIIGGVDVTKEVHGDRPIRNWRDNVSPPVVDDPGGEA